MIFYLDELLENPPALIAYLAAFMVAFITGIAFHEFSHAWAANELGDATAARQGRLTLNPIRHLDPYGTVLLLLIGFGWGKPTPVNPYNLRNGIRKGSAMVAFAGPASNFVFATIAALPLRLGLIDAQFDLNNIENASGEEIVALFLYFIVFFNVLLGIFNLIPIHPLDGFKVVWGLLPRHLAAQFRQLEPYGPGILMVILVIGFIAPQYSPLRWIFGTFGDRIFDFLV
jgi:Zn-dependent protease